MGAREPDLIELQRRAALGTMCAGIAHEVHGPLHCAAALLQEARDRAGTPGLVADPVLVDRLTQAAESIGLGLAVLRETMRFARPADSGGRTDLSADADSVLALTAAVRPTGVRVEPRLQRGLPVHGSPTHVRQIALNLVLNAFRAFDGVAGGRVRVETVATGRGLARLLVEDDGPGLPEPVLAHLFEPFAGAPRGGGAGAGLGLHVVKRIIDMLGGTIEVTSSPGRGTAVVVELPSAS